MSKIIYACGPISDTTYAESRNGWRVLLASAIENRLSLFGAPAKSISVASPMRDKEGLLPLIGGRDGVLAAPLYKTSTDPFLTGQGIIARDMNDVLTCDAVVANLLGARKVSIGSMVEFGWASAWRKPIICIMEPDGSNIHEHVFVRQLAGFFVPTLEDAADVVVSLLLPGV